MSILNRLKDDMKTAMRAKEKERLAAIRLIIDAFNKAALTEQGQIELTEQDEMAILDKQAKQRRDAITQYEQGGRPELAEQEKFELSVIQDYLPQQLSADEIKSIITAAISETGASSIKEMGAVMNIIKPKLQGRADMAGVGPMVKELLS